MGNQFGIDLPVYLTQLTLLSLWMGVSTWASYRILKTSSGLVVPLWLAVIWLVPVLGASVAIVAARIQKT